MRSKNKKSFLLATISGLAIAIPLGIVATRTLPLVFTNAQQDSNSLVISPNNPVQNGYVKTTKGSPIYVKNDGVIWGNNNLTFENGGYIQTLTCIHGIQTISVEMTTGSLDLYHGYVEPSNLETPMYGVDYNFTSTTSFTYTSDLPHYVRLRANEDSSVSKITITYDCASVTVDANAETLDDGLENSYIDAGSIKFYATTSYVTDTSSVESKRALRADFKGTTSNLINLSPEVNELMGIADDLLDFSTAIFTLKAKFSENITNHNLSVQAVGSGWTNSGYIPMDHIETSQDGWHTYQLDFTNVDFENNDQIIRLNIKPLGVDSSNKTTGYIIFDEIDFYQHTMYQEVKYETIYDGLENVMLDYNWQNVDYCYDNKVTYGRTSRSSLVVTPQASLGSHPHYCAILSPEAHCSSGLSEYMGINFTDSVMLFEYKPINVKNPNIIYIHVLETWQNSLQKTVYTTALSDGWYLFSYDLRQLGFTNPDFIRMKIGFDVEAANLNKAKVYFDNIRFKDSVREDYTQGLENLEVDAGMSPCTTRSLDYDVRASESSLHSLKCDFVGDNSTPSWQNRYGPTWAIYNDQLTQMTCNSGRFEAKILFSSSFPSNKTLWFNLFDANWKGARFKDLEPTPIGNGWYQLSIDFSTLPSYTGEKTVDETFDFSSRPARIGIGFQGLDSSNNYDKTVWFDEMFYYPAATSSNFTLWQAYDTENIRQDDSTLSNRGISEVKPLAFHDAKNGTDSSQLMIKANSTISSYNFRPGSLRGNTGDILSASCFDVSIAKYLYCNSATENDKTGYMGAGYYPDALVPIDRIIKAGENTITNGKQQSIWINCSIPKHQMAGTYTGAGILTVDGVDYSIPMKVVVYDVTLSDANHNKTCYMIWYDRMQIAEPVYTGPMRKAYYDFLLEKGISGDSYYEWSKWGVGDLDAYDSFADNFANYIMPNDKISTYRIPMDKTEESVLNYLTALVNRNKIEWDKGNHVNFFDKAIIILSDEPSNPKWNNLEPQAWKDCKTVQNWIKSAQATLAPTLSGYPEILAGLNDVRNVVTIGCDYDRITGQSIYKNLLTTDYIGVPCPQFQLVSPQNQRETFLSRFNHSWFYGCVHPQLPYPSYHTDTPLLGQRMITWMQYNYGFEGTLYFCVNMFSTSDQGEAVLRDVWTDPMVGNTAGDGMLLYPGDRYKIFGPITSMRMENIRNSMEDYELFYLMDQRLNKYNANTGSNITSCRDILASEVSSMFNGTQLLTAGHTFSSGYQSQDFDEFRIYLLQRLEYCY